MKRIIFTLAFLALTSTAEAGLFSRHRDKGVRFLRGVQARVVTPGTYIPPVYLPAYAPAYAPPAPAPIQGCRYVNGRKICPR